MPSFRIPKIVIIGFLSAILGIGLLAVMGLVSERSERRDQVYQDLARTTVSSQTIRGPILVFPFEVMTPVRIVNDAGKQSSGHESTVHYQFVLPKQLEMNAAIKAESRYRSLFEVPFYRSEIDMTGHFDFVPPSPPVALEGSSIQARAPFIMLMIQDTRGVPQIPRFRVEGLELSSLGGLGGMSLAPYGGFHAVLPVDLHGKKHLEFSIALSVQGTQAFHWVPEGEESRVKVSSNWPHPSFQGAALPSNYTMNPEGFEANWQSTHLAGSAALGHTPELLLAAFNEQKVGFKLLQPVDIYLQTERSVKYGFLVIALTFLAFLAFETMKNLSIHPVQYGFVGLALVLFYVLLLAISEHLTFAYAYTLASAACISLISFYIFYIVKTWRTTISFAASLGGLYAIVFGILLSEDYALLYGSIFLFLLLALAMIATRQVDWNGSNRDS